MSKVLHKTWFNFSEKEELRDSIIMSVLAFLIPLFLGKLIHLAFGAESLVTSNTQIIVGTIINSLLVVSAFNLTGFKRLWSIVMLPSIATICSGLLFGPFSMNMVWMMPAIWLGNFAFVYAYKYFFVYREFNYFLTGLFAIIIKVLIIFGVFSILNACGVFPKVAVDALKYSMGVVQTMTGIFGVFLGYLVVTSYKLR